MHTVGMTALPLRSTVLHKPRKIAQIFSDDRSSAMCSFGAVSSTRVRRRGRPGRSRCSSQAPRVCGSEDLQKNSPKVGNGTQENGRKLRVGLVCGGPSAERGISLNSARSVLDHLQVGTCSFRRFRVFCGLIYKFEFSWRAYLTDGLIARGLMSTYIAIILINIYAHMPSHQRRYFHFLLTSPLHNVKCITFN